MKKQKNENSVSLSQEIIEKKIFLIRGKKVMIDRDLAKLYDVPTSRLNEQVKRNKVRFPEDFMFKLTNEEFKNLISQFTTSSWGGIRKSPHVFTEHGILMLSSVLNSEKAVQVNIQIIKTFIKLREIVNNNKDLKMLIYKLENKLQNHEYKLNDYGDQIHVLGKLIKQILELPEKPKRKIGFV